MLDVLEIVRLTPDRAPALEKFFASLVAAGSNHFFHPHPFDQATAHDIASYTGADLFFGVTIDGNIIAYGMLRGWDEGYVVPSLGIAVHPAYRGRSIGRTLMHFLHTAAAFRKASHIRLTVHPSNQGAIQFYRCLGYNFVAENADRLVGKLELTPAKPASST
jgi:[ribosomal protein S18]-alanine N-acetyltransferase